jgi:putative tryptophan/tyrosine transport system substrate-binding protein
MRRRDLIAAVGGAAAWPIVARAQQTPLPVIGFLGSSSADDYVVRLHAFHEGLKEAGYLEGQNVAIEYRWADNHYDRLPALAAELLHRSITVFVAGGGTPAALAAKAATSTIPIVFAVGVDPVEVGLVASLKRPGGNATGVTNLVQETLPKRLELLRELLPTATTIAVLINPTGSPAQVEQQQRALAPTARALGMQLQTVEASNEHDFDAAFAIMDRLHSEALMISPDVFFTGQSKQLAARALRQAIPAVYEWRSFVAAGGLASYGSDDTDIYLLLGVQAGKVLNGEKPADLPVQQATKIELIINLKTAKALGITVPQSIVARADEVIE